MSKQANRTAQRKARQESAIRSFDKNFPGRRPEIVQFSTLTQRSKQQLIEGFKHGWGKRK